jgi:hypothetical protein
VCYKAAQSAGLSAALFTGIGGLRGGKMGANGKMQYNPGWESGSMKTLAAHGLAGGIVQIFQFVGHTLYRSCVSGPSHQCVHVQ